MSLKTKTRNLSFAPPALGGRRETDMKLRILDILNEKGKTKYWLYIQLGLSYQNFNRLVNGEDYHPYQ